MKNFILLIIIIISTSCSSFKKPSDYKLYKTIGNFYFQNKEITKKHKDQIEDKKLIVFKNDNFCSNGLKTGVCFISLSIRHTTSHILITSHENEYYIVKIDEKVYENLDRILNKIQDNAISTITNSEVFITELKKVLRDNSSIKEKRTLKPLY